MRSPIWFGSVAFLIGVYFCFRQVPRHIHLLLAIVAILNLMGELLLGFYYTWEFYDKLLHAIGSLILCVLLYHLIERKISDKGMLLLLSTTAAISIGVIWEILEFLLYKVFNWKMLGAEFAISLESGFFGAENHIQASDRLNDTMMDMVSNILGISAFIAWHFLYSRRKT